MISPEWSDKSIAIIEEGVFGGTCLNRGCIPTKMYVYPATLARSAAEDGERLGVKTHYDGVKWHELRDRVFSRIDAISSGGREYRAEKQDHVTLIQEHAEFIAARTLRTSSGREIHGEQIVIAAGSSPDMPPVPGIDLPGVHTSDTIMRVESLPQSLLIVGGGVIAAEFASIFSGLGSAVTQIARSSHLLRSMDAMISERFTASARERWTLYTDSELSALEAAPGSTLRATFTDAEDREHTRHFDTVLIAIGRTANTAGLNVAEVGFDTTKSGILAVDEYQRVLSDGKPVDGVWALGDISNDYQLKHVANHESRIVAHNLTHPDDLVAANHFAVPAAVFSAPQIATVGQTSAEARLEHGEDVVEYVQNLADVAYGWAMDDHEGVLKVIADRSNNRLLGAHMMSAEASNLIQPLVQAMALHSDLRDVARGQYWIHPAIMEVVENAILGLGLEGGPL